MKLEYSLVGKPNFVVKSAWDALFGAWIKQERPDLEGVVVVSFIGAHEMAILYEQSFGKAEATDVLSFRYQDQATATTLIKSTLENGRSACGEILICTEVAQKNAQRLGVSVANELQTLFVHGLLHLLDLDHATESERAAFEAKTHAIMKVVNEEPAPLWSHL